jgi:hypothetical protein
MCLPRHFPFLSLHACAKVGEKLLPPFPIWLYGRSIREYLRYFCARLGAERNRALNLSCEHLLLLEFPFSNARNSAESASTTGFFEPIGV